ncbi:MAG: polymerase subunit sigma-24 [Actinomycetia bacterium]|nr:polymerase subunit sigma-24 [Actinomycetes bacterium]
MSLTSDEAAILVAAAAHGDRLAWERIVESYGRLIWVIARNHRLSPGDAADVSQTTWLRLMEHIDRLTEPGRVGAWLATTARRECLRIQAKNRRTSPIPDEAIVDLVQVRGVAADDLDAALLSAERSEAVHRAIALLPAHCQEMLRLMMLDPAPTYEEIAAAIGRPIGSLGPSRKRCLEKLRVLLANVEVVQVSQLA